ncbi:polymorphic toxin-type HINT domain-containing protein [Streptomyces canus]|uniref:polymorphic toxin-type HINT domain-containing protein n=1 Tax=Streptomyces canus TaxID=58343 RepID=UPI003865E081|nr:polymorphic toxin-type HINT domain-containing protein [Streptomyces canus]
MADGTTKTIDHIKAGDTIADSVPGASGVEAHKVTAVIVTYTDHDFVDPTIRKTGQAAAKATRTAGAKSLATKIAKKAARKAAFGLAASAAVLGTLTAGHGHGTADQPATTPVAAVSQPDTAHPATTDTTGSTTKGEERGARLTTTFHHPFYDQTQSAFVEARDLKAGDVLQTPTGTAEVTGVRLYHAHTTTYDLTIGTLHTSWRGAGDTPVPGLMRSQAVR